MDAQHPAHDPQQSSSLRDALKDVYVASDRQLGRLLDTVGENDWVIVVSDHGFGPTHRTFYLNEWLQQEGYLALKEQNAAQVTLRSRLVAALAKPAFVLNDVSPLFRRLIAPLKKRALSDFVRTEYVRVKERGLVRLNHLPVDWSRTVAYCPDESTLYLNLRGRDPQGIVEPGVEAERILNEIETGLKQLKTSKRDDHGLEVQVWRKEEIYSGPYLAEAPEMIIALDDFRTNVMAEMGAGTLFDYNPRWSANHRPEGIMVVAGPGIRSGYETTAQIVDIAPTVLHMLGLPVPSTMDGSVLEALFEPGSSLQRRDVRILESQLDSGQGSDLNDEELAEIEKQLKDLGYLN
jgi:predicted AlkP superfamily phosphohydrolase/phosphomutase